MKALRPSRWLPALGIVLALLLLAGAVDYTRESQRAELRAQLARHDAQLVSALFKQRLRAAGEDSPDDSLLDLLVTARLPELPGVMSLRLFDTNGVFTGSVSVFDKDANLTAGQLATVRGGRSAGHFQPAADLSSEFLVLPTPVAQGQGVPLLEVLVPIPATNGVAAGYARFLIDGSSLAVEYAALDATLRRQSLFAFLLAGGAMTVALAFVFRRLTQTQRHLINANRELALAAKTGAVGAVTSHLLHGLKSPLAGLQQFVSAGANVPGTDETTDWSGAADTTRRMRLMIEDVTRLLREDSGLVRYEIEPGELLQHLAKRLGPVAQDRHVTLTTEVRARRTLFNRDANLVLLILENLVTNALQATRAGRQVIVTVEERPAGLEFRVRDEGDGLPESVRLHLFTPVVSTKAGGTGLGLALSRQLARNLGAELELGATGSDGTEFVLRLPASSPTPISQ